MIELHALRSCKLARAQSALAIEQHGGPSSTWWSESKIVFLLKIGKFSALWYGKFGATEGHANELLISLRNIIIIHSQSEGGVCS